MIQCPDGGSSLYKVHRPPVRPLLFVAVLLSFLLTACGVEVAGSNWPGMTVANEIVYLAYGRGIAAIDVEERRLLWTFPEEGNAALQFFAPPSINEERLVFGDFGQTGGFFSPGPTVSVYALGNGAASANRTTLPDPLWVRDDLANDRVIASPTQAEGLVFVGTADNHLLALDADDGDLIWEFETGHSIWAKPVYDDGVVYVASLDNVVYALEAETGDLVWQMELGGSIASSPVKQDGVLYVPSFDRTLHALDATSGSEIWAAPAEEWVWASPAVANGTVYYADIAGNVFAVDADSGDSLWTENVGGAVQSDFLLVDDLLLVAYGEVDGEGEEELGGGLVALDADDGGELWRRETTAPVFTSPVQVGDMVIIAVQHEEGTELLVYEVESGDLNWEFTLPAE